MNGPKVWLSEVTCLKEVVWCECEGDTKDPGQSSRYTPFPTKRAAQSVGHGILSELSTLFRPRPPSMSLFGPLEALALQVICTVMILNPVSRGCYSMPDLQESPLKDVKGHSTGRSSPHEDPSLLRCSTIPCQPCPWHHNSCIPPSPSLHHACASTTYHLLCSITTSYTSA